MKECRACDSRSPDNATAGRIKRDRPRRAPKRGDCRHIGPGAVASDGNANWVGAQLGGMCCGPARRMQAIVDAGREFVLGRKAIIDRGDDASSAGAQISAHPVMGVQAAQDETAAVKEHE
jgi:hypothetical protein